MEFTAEDKEKLELIREKSKKEKAAGQTNPHESLLNSETQKSEKRYGKLALTVVANGIIIFVLALFVVVFLSLGVRPSQNNISELNIALLISLILIIFHSRATVIEKLVQARNAAARWVFYTTTVISLILLGVYATLSFSIYINLLAWPHSGSLAYFPLLILCCGMVFQLSYLANILIKRNLPVRRRGVRIFSIIGGVVLATIVAGNAQTAARQQFEASYQPLVELVESSLPDPCSPTLSYYENEALEGRRKRGKLFHNSENFILLFDAVSADIDGAYILYSSDNKKWGMLNGNFSSTWEYLKGLNESMTACQIR